MALLTDDDVFGAPSAPLLSDSDVFGEASPKPKQNTGIAGDIGTALKRGVLQMPGMATGLADIAAAPVSIATGVNRPVSRAADWLGEQTGLQFGKWAEAAGAEYSPEMQQAQQNVEQAKGFFPTLGAVAQNPRVAAQVVAESLPATIAGGLVARGAMGAVAGAEKLAALRAAAGSADAAVANAARRELLKSGAIAAGVGEGAVSAGQQMAQTGYDVDPALAAGTALGAGIGTGVIGGLSGRVAGSAFGRRLGLSDIETSMAAGTLGENASKAGIAGYAKRIGAGVVQEGLLEEAPQSYQEQVWQNIAAGKPWSEGSAEEAALGAVAGGVMGGAVNAIPRSAQPAEQPPAIQPIAQELAAAARIPDPQVNPVAALNHPASGAIVKATAEGVLSGAIPPNTPATPATPAAPPTAAVVAPPPQGLVAGVPITETTPAAPGASAPVSTAATSLTTNQVEPAGVPTTGPTADASNQAQIAVPSAQGSEAQPATGAVAGEVRQGIASAAIPPLQYPKQTASIAGPLPQTATAMPVGRFGAPVQQPKKPAQKFVRPTLTARAQPSETSVLPQTAAQMPVGKFGERANGVEAPKAAPDAGEQWILRRPDTGRVIVDAISGQPKTYGSIKEAQDAADSFAVLDKPVTFSNRMPKRPRPEKLSATPPANVPPNVSADISKPAAKPRKSPDNSISADRDSLLVAIAKLGGMSTGELTSNGFDQKDITRPSASRISRKTGKTSQGGRKPISFGFNMPLHRKIGGLSFDGVLEALKQYGYFPESASVNDVIDAVRGELGGRTYYTPEAIDRQATMDADERNAELAAQQERIDAELAAERAIADSIELDAESEAAQDAIELFADDFDIDAPSASSDERAFLISMGMTEEEADAELNESRQAQPAGAGEVQAPVDEAPAAGPGEGGGKGAQVGADAGANAGEAEVRPGLDLQGQTPEEIKASGIAAEKAAHDELIAKAAEARKEKAAKDKAEKDRRAAEVMKEREAAKKAEVDKAAEEFALGQAAPEPVVKKVTTEEAKGQKDIFAAPAPAAKPNPDQSAIDKANSDFDDALNDLGDIIGKPFRANFTPEQEQKIIPVLTRLMDAAFRKGYYKFKEAARFVLESIVAKFGKDLADQITLDHLQGAYIGMAGRYKDQGADSAKAVVSVEDRKEVEPRATDELPPGWVEAYAGGMATNTDKVSGGIVDTNLKTGKWFFVPENDNIGTMEGFDTRREALDALSMEVEKAAKSTTLKAKGLANVTNERSGSDLERDSQDANIADGMGAQGVPVGAGGNGGAGRPGVAGSGAEGNQPAGGNGLRDGEAAIAGERGNLEVHTGETKLSPGSAGNSVDLGGDSVGVGGLPIEPDAAGRIKEAARGGIQLEVAKAKQRAADKAPFVKGLEAIRQSLPILTEGQQEDVFKTETRFAVPDGYGMLFTNGTGTGKTFSALGVIKRFAAQGKQNILVVAPSQEIISAWQKAGKLLGLDLSLLEDINDAGSGMVITTYANMGANNELANRDWDLIVHDEAHYLSMNKDGTNTESLNALRAISLHPDGAFKRAIMLHGDIRDAASIAQKQADIAARSDDARDWPMAKVHQARANKLNAEFNAKHDAIKADVAARQLAKRPRVMFLSATPFAYEKSVDWANGYLFDYNEGRGDERNEFRGYNAGSNSDQFMMQHFGYRMRYGKLTAPDAKVDSGLMQRQFNSWLKKSGSLSGRMLDVDADYDRRFILVDSAIGQRIDEALQWFDAQRKATNDKDRQAAISAVQEFISEKFDYLSRRYLLESIKAKEVVPHVREHLAMGRKVVVFHDYKKGGGFNPFIIGERTVKDQDSKEAATSAAEWNGVVGAFNAEFKDIINSDLFKQTSPILMFKNEFPGVLLFNGDVSVKDRRANVQRFHDDDSGPQVILVQSAAGKEGISLHDTTGKHQRVLFNLGQPTQPTTAIQQEGRIYRTGQVTDAIFRYLNTGTNWEKWAFATTIANRASAAENLGMGELARSLKDAFIAGFEESDNYRAGMDGEGKGGKERDKAANNALTEYDRARAFYFGTQKKNGRTKAQEGADYFATPEPVGLKMVEWANVLPGEKVLEPSAGHGAIARWMPTTAERTAVEPSMTLRPRLAMVFDGQIIDSDFESLNVVNKYDAIVMNPPFGSGGKTAIDHLAKAATHLRDGGRIVALLPTGPAADKKFEKWFYEEEVKPSRPVTTVDYGNGPEPIYRGDTIKSTMSWQNGIVVGKTVNGILKVKTSSPGETLVDERNVTAVEKTGQRTESYKPAAGLNIVADIKLPQVTFERAGTAVSTRIVVIEKSANSPQQTSRDLSDVADINTLFDSLENMALPARAKEPEPEAAAAPAKKEKAPPAQVGDSVTVNGNQYAIEIYTTNDGKDKRGIWMEEKEAKAINPRAFKSSKMRGTPAEGKFFVDEYWLNKRAPDSSSRFSFAGQQSATADQFQLTRAKQLLSDGANANAVRQQTGWFKGVDGKWRYEIDDSGASLKAHGFGFGELLDALGTNLKLADVLDHPALFAAYPSIAGASVEAIDEKSQNNGELVTNKDGGFTIRVNAGLGEAKALSVMLHEIQHGIQNVEGFASGGSPAYMAGFSHPQIRMLENKISTLMTSNKPGKQIAQEVSSLNAKIAELRRENPYDAYRRLAGEVESRNVQQRQNFTADKRKYSDPFGTQDVAPEDVIIVFNGKDAKDAPTPFNTTRRAPASAIGTSPSDSAVYQMAQEGKTAAEILAFLAKASRRPFNRVLAVALQKAGLQTSITVDPQGGWSVGNRSYAAKYAAAYSPKADKVALFTPRDAERHVLHELTHAATLKAINAGGAAAMRMTALFKHVEKSGKLEGMYGMSTLDEFVAEVFSNPKFRAALESVPAPAGSTLKTAWDWFVRIVARVLGFQSNGPHTALDRALRDGVALMEENAAIRAQATGGDRYGAASTKDAKEASEYEARLFGGSYDNNRLRGAPKDAPIRKMIANARQRYNELRKSAGLQEISDWTKAPKARVTDVDNPRYSADDLPPTITVDGVERPTTNSNGKPIHPTVEGARNFWRWFGESKVTDDQGRPLVVYHGTMADVASFAVDKQDPRDSGFWFGSAQIAGSYSASANPLGNNIIPARLSIKNPKVYYNRDVKITPELIRQLKEDGFDGVKRDFAAGEDAWRYGDTAEPEWAAFRPNQVKSAIGNAGSFSDDPDIRYNLAANWPTSALPQAKAIRDTVATALRSDANTSWITPFNTQYHKAEKWAADGKPLFKRVFNLVQQFLGDVSKYAVMAQNAAPTLLHEWRTVSDVKAALSGGDLVGRKHRADIAAVAMPLYDGTLYGGGNPMNGIKWSDERLRTKYKLTDRQIKLYHEALAAVNVSMDEMAKSVIAQHAKREKVGFDSGMDIDDMSAGVLSNLEDKKQEIMESVGEIAQETVNAQIADLKEMDRPDEADKLNREFDKAKKDAKAGLERIDKTIGDINGIVAKNKALQAAGYFPLMRFGKHTVTARDKDGKVQFFGMYDGIPLVPGSGQAEANRVAAQLKEEFPDWDVKTDIVNDQKYKLYQGVNLDALQLFAEHMEKDDVEPFQEFVRMATNNRSAQRRLLHRKGTPGFDKDVRRTMAQFITSNARATSSNYHTQDMLRAAAEAEADGGDIGAEAIKLVKYVQDPIEEAQALRGFLFFNFLGGSIASAMVNLTQTPAMTLPYLSKFEQAPALMRRTMAAARMAAGKPETIADQNLRHALMRAELDGVTAPQEIHQLMATAANNIFAGSRAANILLRGWGAPFAMAESFNRRIAFITAFKIGEGMGNSIKNKTGFDNAFDFAEDVVKQTQGIYNKGNRMNIGRGAVGATLLTFKQYSVMYLELLKRLPPKQRAIMVGVLLLSAGAGGLPGVDDLEDLWDTVGQWLGYATNSKRSIRNSLTEFAGAPIADVVLNGVLSRMGIDLHSRLGMQNLIPGTGILKQSSTDKGRDIEEFFGPAASVIKSAGDALENMATGRPGKAAMAVSPVAIRNAALGGKMAATGFAQDASGRNTVPVNEAEAFAKGIGFNPKSVAEFGSVKRDLAQDQRLVGVKREEFAAAMADAVLNNDPEARLQAIKDLQEWNQNNPFHRVTITPESIAKRVRDARAEGATRMLRSLPKGMRTQAAEEFRQ